MALSFLQTTGNSTTQTIYTFATQNLGTASSDRYIIVSAVARKAGTPGNISTVTVGGGSATILGQNTNTVGSNNSTAGLVIAAVPTGTTGDIVVTMSTAFLRCSIAAWAATNLATANVYHVLTSLADDPIVSLNIPMGGFGVAGSIGAGTATATWTGLTEDYDSAFNANSSHSGASQLYSSKQVALSIKCDWSLGSGCVGVFASFQFKNTKTISGVAIASVKQAVGTAIASLERIVDLGI